MTARIVKLGLLLSVFHFLLTGGTILYTFRMSMARFDNSEIPVKLLESMTKVTAEILTEPVKTLWSKWLNRNFQPLELLFFAANSMLWGFTLATFYLFGTKLITKT